MRDLQMKIYDNSPIFFQNILTSLEGYRNTKKRYGDIYYSFLIELENQSYLNEEAMKKYQEQELRKLIAYAYEKSPFYKKFYKDIDLASIQTIEDLKKLPVLDKEMIARNIDSMYTVADRSNAVANTSVKAGTPLKFLFTKEDIQKRMAFYDFFKKQHGAINLEMKRASFSFRRFVPINQQKNIYWRDNHYIKQRLYSPYFCNEQTAGKFIANLEEFQPDFMDGLPSSIYELAKYINRHRIILSFQPVAIFTTGEKLLPHQRIEIEEAFDCPVRNQYMTSEGAPFIGECVKGKLHYNMNSGVIETSDKGEMIVTCFHTYGTPLIRYNIGDIVQLPKNKIRCECGSVHPVFEQIHNGTTDYIQSKSKGKFSAVYLSKIGKDFSGIIKQIQFVQNSLESIDVYVEGAEGYTNAITEQIHKEMVYTFGDDMIFNIRVVEEIPKLPNSSFQPVVNNLMQSVNI